MIFSGLFLLGEVPFTDVIINSTVLALDGRRMSKSLGTGIDPLEAVARYGADATRYGLLKISSTQDVRFSWGAIEEGAKLANKLWNVARLILQKADGIEPVLRPAALEERWIVGRIDETRAELEELLPRFDFAHAADALYHLTFDDFCDWYAEAIKPRLYADDAAAIGDGARGARAAARAAPSGAAPRHRGDLVAVPRQPADPRPLARPRRGRPGGGRGDEARPERCDDLPAKRQARPPRRRGGADLRRRRQARAPRPRGGRRRRARARAARARRSRAPSRCSRTSASSPRRRPRSSRPSGRSSRATAPSSQRSRASRPRRGRPRLAREPLAVARGVRTRRGCGRSSPTSAIPQRAFPAIHVVGTNGKTSTTLLTAALLRARGLRVGATISPHVRGFAERIQVDGAEADLGAALARVRAARRGRDAVRGADGGGAGRVRRARGRRRRRRGRASAAATTRRTSSRPASSCSRTSRSSTPRCSARRARRSPPRSSPSSRRAPSSSSASRSGRTRRVAAGAARVDDRRRLEPRARRRRRRGLPRPARSIRAQPRPSRCPGRLERRSEQPLEIWDGAHNLAGIGYLLARLPARRYTIVASILADKHAEEMLRALTRARRHADRDRLAESACRPGRGARPARPAAISRASRRSPTRRPRVARARELAGPAGAVLVTGSLYLLAALSLDG